MFFLLPIGVEGNEVRVPVVCLAILALCVVGFFGTWVLPTRAPLSQSEVTQVLKYYEEHPYLAPPRSLFDELNPGERRALTKERTTWLETHTAPAPEVVAQEQHDLDARFDKLLGASQGPLHHLALVPARGWKQIGWLTHMFLHFGWLHLIGNLLFFYLCGPLLEDSWGRKLFAAFYLVGGLFAALAHFAIDPSSHAAMAGASGAIAACMGAFAVRFATRKVALLYIIFVGFRIFRGVWHWPAWVCGLLWFGSEVLTAVLSGGHAQGVAVMAHVGGFGFGAAIAFGMKAAGLEKQFIGLSEETVGPMAPSLLAEVEQGNRLLAQGDHQAARARFEAGLKKAPDDVDASLALVKLDLDAKENGEAMARLEPLLGRLMRESDNERAMSVLGQLWPQLNPGNFKPGFAFNLARSADAAGPAGEGLALALYSRGGAGLGLMGAKSLLRAAELALKTTEPHQAGAHLQTLLARADAGPELLARAKALHAQVPAPPVAAAVMESGLELDRRPGGSARPAPKVVGCVLVALTTEGLSLRSSTGDQNAVKFSQVLAVAAGLVPVTAPGTPTRGVLLVDLILTWGDASTAAVAVRLDSDTTAMSKLFPGPSAAQVYGAFFAHVIEASGATALTPLSDLTSGKFPRFPSIEARDVALFSAGG